MSRTHEVDFKVDDADDGWIKHKLLYFSSLSLVTFCELLCKYEEASITEFSNQQVTGVLKNSPAMSDIKFLKSKIANPFKEMYYWVKGEVYDLRVRSAIISANHNNREKQNGPRRAKAENVKEKSR